MKVFETTQIRNVGLVGHGGSGKTALAEAMLWMHRQIEKMGATSQGNTVSDYDPEEVRRGHSITASLIPIDAKDLKINLLDTPGRRDFTGHIRGALRVCDAAVIVLDASAGGHEIGAQFAWDDCDLLGVRPRVAFINKMDRERADFEAVFNEMRHLFPVRAVAVTLPVGAEAGFKGVIDLIKMKFIEENDRKVVMSEIPAEYAAAAQEARARLVEAAAEGDEDLMTRFLEDQPLGEEEILRGIREGMEEGRVLPVLCGSATQGRGLTSLVGIIRGCCPDPTHGTPIEFKQADTIHSMKAQPSGLPLLYVFKTVADPFAGHLSFFKVMRGQVRSESSVTNVNRARSERIAHVLTVCGRKSEHIEHLNAGDLGAAAKLDSTHTWDTLAGADTSIKFTPVPLPKPTQRMAVSPRNKSDEDKVGLGFHRLIEQDPTLHLYRDPEVHQTILEGMGEAHLDVAVHQLKSIAHVDVELHPPKIPYRETITRIAEGQGKYKKQSGGRGQFGDCWIRFEPLPEGSGFQFEWAVVGGVIPTKYSAAVEKGLHDALERGVLSGHKTVDIKAVCYDGSHHAVDSSEMAFKVAASLAFKQVVPKAGPVLLEPIMKVRITIPESFMGDVMGDLNGRRGRISTSNGDGRRVEIVAMVPLAEMATYGRSLRSITHGAGWFEMEFDHYTRVPGDVQEKIAAAWAQEKGEDKEE